VLVVMEERLGNGMQDCVNRFIVDVGQNLLQDGVLVSSTLDSFIDSGSCEGGTETTDEEKRNMPKTSHPDK